MNKGIVIAWLLGVVLLFVLTMSCSETHNGVGGGKCFYFERIGDTWFCSYEDPEEDASEGDDNGEDEGGDDQDEGDNEEDDSNNPPAEECDPDNGQHNGEENGNGTGNGDEANDPCHSTDQQE